MLQSGKLPLTNQRQETQSQSRSESSDHWRKVAKVCPPDISVHFDIQSTNVEARSDSWLAIRRPPREEYFNEERGKLISTRLQVTGLSPRLQDKAAF